jgi:hypothetical protein
LFTPTTHIRAQAWISAQQTIATRTAALRVKLRRAQTTAPTTATATAAAAAAAAAAATADEAEAEVVAINKLIAEFNLVVPASRLQQGPLNLEAERQRAREEPAR